MALQEQQISLKFAGGIETKMDSKAVPAARLLTLQNGVFTRAISIKKRNGYSLLSRVVDGGAVAIGPDGSPSQVVDSLIEGARRLAARDNELLLFTRTECFSKQSATDQWTDAGPLIAPVGYDRAAVHTGTAQTMPDHATSGGVTAYAWEDSLGGVWWTVVDATSGHVYRTPAQANASGERPRCVPVGDVIHIYYAVPTQNRINVIIVNPSSPSAAVAERIVVEDLDTTNPVYDACPSTHTGTPAFMVWHENATTNMRAGFVTAGGELGAPANGLPGVGTHALAMHATSPLACAFTVASGSDVMVASYVKSDNTGRIFYMTPTPDAAGGTNTLYAATTSVQRTTVTVAPTDSSVQVWAVFEEAAAEPTERYCVVNSRIDATTGTQRTLRSVGLASRGFLIEDDSYASFVHDATYFNTYLTLHLADFAPVGRHLPGSACGPTQTHLPSVYVDDNVATWVTPYKTRLASANNDKFTESALRTIVMDFDSEDTHQTAQLGRGLYMSGACPQHYDGRLWTEQSFHFGPDHITTAAAAGGSMTPSSTYEYVVWYEWTDAQGEIHRGATSVGVVAVTGGADTQVTITVPTLRVTRKTNVRICVARSLPGDATRFWRVSSLDPTTTGDVNGYITNNISIDSVDFVDQMADSTLQLQEELYTTGGILSNDPAALGSHIVAGKNRLFFTDAEAGNVVRFSQRLASGFGAEIAPELQHDIDPYGGDITALAIMDDVVYVFKTSCIFAFNGDGPFETGSTTGAGPTIDGFSASQIITSDVGCTDPSSIVLTPNGLLFKSAKGIYQIDRSRQVSYVGSPVEAFNAQNVRRATVMPDRTAVLFLTDSGESLYYDYLFQQWSTFTNHEGLDAAVVENTYHYLRANDVVFRETVGEYADGNARITLRLETAWLHLYEHLQGFQRFWRLLLLGTWSSPHQLAVSHRLDYDEAWSEPYYLDATGTEFTDAVTATGELVTSSTPITLRSKLHGAAGNLTEVRLTDSGFLFPGHAGDDTPTLVELFPNTQVDFTTDSTWQDVVDWLNLSNYVEVTSTVVPAGDVTPSGLQSIFLSGGSNESRLASSAGWITGDSANPIGEDPVTGSAYGDGAYGAGAYGGTGPDVYQWRYGIHEKGQSIQFRFEDFEKAGLSGASFELTEMTIVGGVMKPDLRPFSKARST